MGGGHRRVRTGSRRKFSWWPKPSTLMYNNVYLMILVWNLPRILLQRTQDDCLTFSLWLRTITSLVWLISQGCPWGPMGFATSYYMIPNWFWKSCPFFNVVVSSSDLLSVFLHIGVPHHLIFLFAFNSCGPGNQITRLMKVIFNTKHRLWVKLEESC